MHFGQLEQICDHSYPSYSDKNPFVRGYKFQYHQPFGFEKGEELGYFKMGSTVVCIFEEKKDLEFTVKCGDDIKFGEGFCSI